MKRYATSPSRPFALEDLVTAYRHAKADLFAEKSIPSRLALVEFEQNLIGNLKGLLRKLNLFWRTGRFPWSEDQEFLGEVFRQPKKVDCSGSSGRQNSVEEPHLYVTDPEDRWKHIKEKFSPKADYRPMAIPSIEFQVLTELWMMKVGHMLDAKLLPSCRGNRLKRVTDYSNEDGQLEELGSLNVDSPGIFRPYHQAYRNWRSDGLKAIETEITNGNEVIAITMDLREYFHRIDPGVVGNEAFWLETFGIELSPDQARLNKILAIALRAWAERLPGRAGLPVGLLASRVIANALLHEFDLAIANDLNPIFYARYVDDILLVIRPQRKLDSPRAIMNYVADGISGIARLKEDGLTLALELKNVGNSKLEFGANKQRIFDFRGKAGLDLLATINREIDELSSEFRLMPDFSEEEDSVLRQALVADHDFEVGADSLRKADSLTIRRLGLAILLRNHEMLERCMASPKEWEQIRQPFYCLLEEHVLTPERYCTYFQYLPRIFGLIAANADWEVGERLLKKVEWIHKELEKLPGISKEKQ